LRDRFIPDSFGLFVSPGHHALIIAYETGFLIFLRSDLPAFQGTAAFDEQQEETAT
jgi:hypothetical protein